MRWLVLAFLSGWAVLLAPSHGAWAETFQAGFTILSLTDPVEGGAMSALAVYPVRSGNGPVELGPFTIAATRGAVAMPGPHPLIVVSHGTGGNMLGHHDSLVALAQAGFVAVAVEHPRDNFRDDSGFGTDLQLVGRPHHVTALIDALLKHSTLGPLIDRTRIGMAGHSVGGYTALLIAGAVPKLALREAYRQAVSVDPLRARADAVGAWRRKPDLPFTADERVRAIFLMAPALGYLFDEDALAKVRIPVRLWRPEADEILIHPWNAERIARMLPARPEYDVLEGAGHFVFLAPCAAAFAARLPAICVDPPGIDRAAVHARLNADMIGFFRRSLDVK